MKSKKTHNNLRIAVQKGGKMEYRVIEKTFRNALLKNNLTLSRLSVKSGVSITTIDKAINKQLPIRVSTCNKIAAALDIPVTDLFE